MSISNGTTENITRRDDKGYGSDQPNGLAIIRQSSKGDEHHPFGIDSEDCTRGNPTGTNCIQGDTSPGKILQRLELVEQSHKEYVRAHQTRLKARLDESEKLMDSQLLRHQRPNYP